MDNFYLFISDKRERERQLITANDDDDSTFIKSLQRIRLLLLLERAMGANQLPMRGVAE